MSEPQKKPKPELPASLRKARAAARGRPAGPPPEEEKEVRDKSDGKAEPLFPVTETKAEEEALRAAAERARKEQEARIGISVEGKGVYLGPIDLKDAKGQLVGAFNLYAAPKDLTRWSLLGPKRLTADFEGTCKHLAGLMNFYGHKGHRHSFYQMDEHLYDCIRGGRYRGEWFIPTLDMMVNHIYPNRDKKELANSFATSAKDFDMMLYYWTCTEKKGTEKIVYKMNIQTGTAIVDSKTGFDHPTRCVRLEPRR